MHSVTTAQTNVAQSRAASRHAGAQGSVLIRRWLTPLVTKWRRRKIVGALEMMDTRLLRDMGIERCDIKRIVEGFDQRELRMVPLAQPQPVARIDRPSYKQAA